MSQYELRTEKGYDFYEVASALQKAIRRGDKDTAMYFAVELFNSGFGEYLFKRLKIIASEDVGLAHPLMPAVIHALYENFKEQAKKKDSKHKPERLFVTHAVLLLCEAKKSRFVDWTLISYWNDHPLKKTEIPDYAFDKHNRKGKLMGRGIEHFYEEGTHLENHFPYEGEAEMKEKALNSELAGQKKLFE